MFQQEMKTIILGTRGNEKSLYHGLGFQLSYQRQGASFLPEALGPGRKRGKRGKRRKGCEMREIMFIEPKYG